MSQSFAAQGSDDVAILLSTVAQRDVLRSTVALATVELVAADVAGIASVHGVPAVSAEIHMGTNLRLGQAPAASGHDPVLPAFVRGVTERAFLVHESVTLIEGNGPSAGEVAAGPVLSKHTGQRPAGASAASAGPQLGQCCIVFIAYFRF